MQRKLVGWNQEYSLDMPELDAQHKTLFDLINKLWLGIVENASLPVQIRLIEQLEHYTITHFSEEEVFLRSIDYPDFNKHQRAHAGFVQRIARERIALSQGGQISLDLLHFLNDWLVEHIRVKDRAYADYSSKRQERSVLGRFFKLFA